MSGARADEADGTAVSSADTGESPTRSRISLIRTILCSPSGPRPSCDPTTPSRVQIRSVPMLTPLTSDASGMLNHSGPSWVS